MLAMDAQFCLWCMLCAHLYASLALTGASDLSTRALSSQAPPSAAPSHVQPTTFPCAIVQSTYVAGHLQLCRATAIVQSTYVAGHKAWLLASLPTLLSFFHLPCCSAHAPIPLPVQLPPHPLYQWRMSALQLFQPAARASSPWWRIPVLQLTLSLRSWISILVIILSRMRAMESRTLTSSPPTAQRAHTHPPHTA